MKVLITIPAYNEEKTISTVINEIQEVMNRTKWAFHILVIDDGSKDCTAEFARKAGAIVISHKNNRGLAEAFKTEMDECSKRGVDIIVHTDADGQYPAKYIPSMIAEINNGADLVLGSRFGKGSYSGPFMNKLGNVLFAKVISQLLKIRITDTTTGFRAFVAEVARVPLVNNFTYTQEQIIRASKQGLNIKEIPIETRKTRESRLFKSPIQYALKAWINIFRIYRDYDPLRFFGIFGGLFFIFGFIFGVWVLYSVMTTGGVGGIPRVILSALFILTGIQIILFGFFADMVKK